MSDRIPPLCALLGLLFAACTREELPPPPPKPISERVTWEGQAPARAHSESLAVAASAPSETAPARVHTLEFQSEDALQIVLREFSRDWQAYQAFQARATAEEIRAGFYWDSLVLVFIHGPYLGELRHARSGLLTGAYLRERLAFAGEELFRRPAPFLAFPVAGQIPHSERVVSPEFLGPGIPGVTFQMRYLCGLDTATLYRGFTTARDSLEAAMQAWKGRSESSRWSGEKRFSGLSEWSQPRIFWIFKGGYLGVDGCYDPDQAQEYAEKMQKMTVILQDP